MIAADQGHTRRSLLQAGAALAVGAMAARGGSLASAATTARVYDEQLYPGELRLFAGSYVPAGWLECVGSELMDAAYPYLAQAIKGAFPGSGQDRFRLPDARGRGLAGAGQPPGGPSRKLGEYGRAIALRSTDKNPSTLGLTCLINPDPGAAAPFVGEVRAFAFSSRFVPADWEVCDGRELTIVSNTALYAVIGPGWGAATRDRFRLPDLRGATPVGVNTDDPQTPKTHIAERRLDLAPDGPGRRPRVQVTYCICTNGSFPGRS